MTTLEEALHAQEQGANRVELCRDLAVGGLTPEQPLMEAACRALTIPVMVMIRPRAGGFVYSGDEADAMIRSIDHAREAGAAGVVLGLLGVDGGIDVETTARLAAHAMPLEVTFHKAVDELPDPVAAVRVLRAVTGVTRVLSSGGAATAQAGVPVLRRMVAVAGDELTIMGGGSVTEHNVDELAELTGAAEFHGRRIVGDPG